MKIGFVGAGRVGCSMGKYFVEHGMELSGYYSPTLKHATWAASFTKSNVYQTLEELVGASDTLFIATVDSAIAAVWDCIAKMPVQGKVIGHFSGSLSVDVFHGIEAAGAYGCSVHPMFAFASKESAYQSLDQVHFTMEGNAHAISVLKEWFQKMGNPVHVIETKNKVKYHAAASMVSNQVIGLVEMGLELLEKSGFSREEAAGLLAPLMQHNMEAVIQEGCESALTGPLERNDIKTVAGYLSCLGGNTKRAYVATAKPLVKLAQKKHPDTDYGKMEALLS